MLVGLLIAWTTMAAPAVAGPAPTSGSPAPNPESKESVPASTRQDADTLSHEDEELIKNLDLIENLDLLDTVEVLGAVNAPDTAEEEF